MIFFFLSSYGKVSQLKAKLGSPRSTYMTAECGLRVDGRRCVPTAGKIPLQGEGVTGRSPRAAGEVGSTEMTLLSRHPVRFT